MTRLKLDVVFLRIIHSDTLLRCQPPIKISCTVFDPLNETAVPLEFFVVCLEHFARRL